MFDELIHIDDYVGLKKYHDRENNILQKLRALQAYPNTMTVSDPSAIYNVQKQIYAHTGKQFEFTDEQINAIMAVVDNNVVVITGSAGTGKTMIIRTIVKLFEKYSYACCTLSAKAATRIRELTHYDASTIHKLLEYGKYGFKYNKEHPLPHWLIIADEFSMNNSGISWSLIQAIQMGAKVVLVGDHEQLPPIGAGAVFGDLLQSDLKVCRLTKIHRQEQDSGIIVDSNMVKDGLNPFYKQDLVTSKWYTHGNLKDIHYWFNGNNEKIQQMLIRSFLRGVEKFGMDEVKICVPMKERGLNSTVELNRSIQEIVIEDKSRYVKKTHTKMYINDRVIQRENDYQGKGVVNGEIGRIKDISGNEFLVDYGDRVINYTERETRELELAYALTVHLFQGSQNKLIITGMDMCNYIMLSRQLLYTAMTRSTTETVFVGDYKAFNLAIKIRKNQRTTFLQKLLNTK